MDGDSLTVSYWDASGLRVQLDPFEAHSQRTLLYWPNQATPVRVEVTSLKPVGVVLDLALYVSRIEFDSVDPFFRTVVNLEAPSCRLTRGDLNWENWHALDPGESVRFSAAGPARAMILSRLRYEPEGGALARGYSLVLKGSGTAQVFELLTVLDTSSQACIDGKACVLGQERAVVAELPWGRSSFSLESTAPLYVRVLGYSRSDRLLPSVELERRLSAESLRRYFHSVYPADHLSEGHPFHELLASNAATDLLTQFRSPDLRDRALEAAALARRIGSAIDAPPRLRSAALRASGRFTRWQSLSPTETRWVEQALEARFTLPSFLENGGRRESPRLHHAYVPYALGGFGRARFVAMPRTRERCHSYRLPPRSADSRVRLLVLTGANSSGELLVEFVGDRTHRLSWTPTSRADSDEIVPSLSDGALAVLRETAEVATDKLALQYGTRVPLPYRAAAAAELFLPVSVGTVRVWNGGDHPPAAVALQYEVGDPYELSEQEFLESRALSDARGGGFPRTPDDVLAGENVDAVQIARRDLRYAFSDRQRALEEAPGRFAGKVDSRSPVRVDEWVDFEEMESTATAAERDGDWLGALEAWRGVVDRGGVESYPGAFWGSIRALERLGEFYLARLQLRRQLQLATEGEWREELLENLLRLERQSSEIGSRDLILAEVSRRNFQLLPDYLNDLLGRGQYRDVIGSGHGLPNAAAIATAHAAFKLRWSRVFDVACENMPVDSRSFWRGLEAAARRDYETAFRRFESGGRMGAQFRAALEEGLQIRDDLNSGNPGRCLRGIIAWERWNERHPGPRRWRRRSDVIARSAGAGHCNAPPSSVYESYHRVQPQRRAELRILGPARVRLRCRPLHPRAGDERLSGWLKIEQPGLLHLHSIVANKPSPNLQFLESQAWVPGRLEFPEFRVGPGSHRIDLSSDLELLFQVEIETPELALPVLPAWHPATLFNYLGGLAEIHSVASGEPPRGTDSGKIEAGALSRHADDELTETSSEVHVLDDLGAVRHRVPIRRRTPLRPSGAWRQADAFFRRSVLQLDALALARVQLRLEAPTAAALQVVAAAADPELAEEAFLASQQLARQPTLRYANSDVPDRLREAHLLASERFEEILELPLPVTAAALQQRLMSLLYVQEKRPGLRQSCQTAALEFRADALRFDLKDLYQAVVGSSVWESIRSIIDGDGVRYIEQRGWRPENPVLRVRRALISGLTDEHSVITADRAVRLEADLPTRVRWRVTLARAAVEGLPRAPLRVAVRVDEEETRIFEIVNEQRRVPFEIDLQRGQHSILFSLSDSRPSEYVSVLVEEEAEGRWQPALSPRKRMCFVASWQRPVRVPIDGPAWVRTDEYRGRSVLTRHRFFATGEHELVLTPAPGRKEALFRIARQRLLSDADLGRSGSRLSLVPPTEGDDGVARPTSELAHFVDPGEDAEVHPPRLDAQPNREDAATVPEPSSTLRSLVLEDAVTPNRQEDGTVLLRLDARRRRIFDEDNGGNIEQYLQLTAHHLYYSERYNLWFDTSVLTRVREFGGPTYGVAETVRFRPRGFPLTLSMRGQAFVQWPQGDRFVASDRMETSARLSARASRRWDIGRKAYHRFAVSMFGRYLSLDRSAGYDLRELDQDIFSSYKRQHRKGLSVSETLGYRPWLDTEWQATVSLSSNEDIHIFGRPDNFAAQATWKQFFGGARVEGGYRFVRFLNDGDRLNAANRDAIFIETFYEYWLNPNHRLEVGAGFRHDIKAGENTGFVSLVWHFAKARRYRDYAPGQVDFEPLRERFIPRVNNTIRETDENDSEAATNPRDGAEPVRGEVESSAHRRSRTALRRTS